MTQHIFHFFCQLCLLLRGLQQRMIRAFKKVLTSLAVISVSLFNVKCHLEDKLSVSIIKSWNAVIKIVSKRLLTNI